MKKTWGHFAGECRYILSRKEKDTISNYFREIMVLYIYTHTYIIYMMKYKTAEIS